MIAPLNVLLATGKRFALIALLALPLMAGWAMAQEVVVHIGHAGPLTGPLAHDGKDNENGVRLAIDEANAEGVRLGGKKITFLLVSEDDQADPRKSTIVAQKLADAQVKGVIGHLNSGAAIPASRIYHDGGIPYISPGATNPLLTHQGFKNVFRVTADDVQQGRVLADYAVKRLAARSIAVVDDRSAYGQGLADEFEKAARAAGARIVAREFTGMDKTDFTAILTSIKRHSPDLIFYAGNDVQSGPMVRQMKQLGLRARFLTGDGSRTPEFLNLAGEAADGVIASQPGLPLERMPGGPAFAEKYKAKYGMEFQLWAPYAYDATRTIVAAMKKADSADPAKYLPALASASYRGVTGTISFDENGDLKNGGITVYQVKSGKWQVVDTFGGAAPRGN